MPDKKNQAIFTLNFTKKPYISHIVHKSLHPLTCTSNFAALDHEALAEKIFTNKGETASVIVNMKYLHKRHFEDPLYLKSTAHIICSQIEEEAKRRMVNKYPYLEELEAYCIKEGLPTQKINYTEINNSHIETNANFKSLLFDALFETYEKVLYPEIINDFKLAYMGDLLEEQGVDTLMLTEEEIETAIETVTKDFDKKWKEHLFTLFQPRIEYEYNRVYNLPEPFHFWDRRNSFQQWFFIDVGEHLEYIQGGSGSSGQRENMGRYAHTFMTLDKVYNQKSPTLWLEYDEHNKFKLVKTFNVFHCVDRELTGNYPADYQEVQEFFKNRLLSLTNA